MEIFKIAIFCLTDEKKNWLNCGNGLNCQDELISDKFQKNGLCFLGHESGIYRVSQGIWDIGNFGDLL